MDSTITFYAIESNDNLNATTTANGYGHWFDASGNVTNWGSNAKVFSELNASSFTFSIGQYPGQAAAGDQYTINRLWYMNMKAVKRLRQPLYSIFK